MIEDDELEADEKARIAALHKSAPERIWLQIDPEAEQFDWWDAQTWCSDQINDTDLEYVRADAVESLRQQLESGSDVGVDEDADQRQDEERARGPQDPRRNVPLLFQQTQALQFGGNILGPLTQAHQ